MPVFEYHCPCGLRFEKMRSAKSAQKAVECKRCGGAVEPQMSAPDFSFQHNPDGIGPQNTGVAGIDMDPDAVIGRDSFNRWMAQNERQTHKKRIMAATGAEGADLSRTFDGDYRVMKPEERKAAETARNLHHTAIKAIEKHVKGKNYLAGRLGKS